MKIGIHPDYRPVIFEDISNGIKFLIPSTIPLKGETAVWKEDGQTYPLVKVPITSSSHPFYTGKEQLVDTAGRIDKFRNRYSKKK